MSQRIQILLEKTNNYDKDERYMATSDLCTELENDTSIEPQLEKKICEAVLRQLNDSSNDVQAVAVKCLSILVKKVDNNLVCDICTKLCDSILSGNSDLRDIYSIGLKTALSDIPAASGPRVALDLIDRILQGVKSDSDYDIKLECLDILGDLLNLYGSYLNKKHEMIADITLFQLSSSKSIIRKRASSAVGQLTTVLDEQLLNRVVESLLKGIQNSKDVTIARTYIQTVGIVGKTVGYRLGSHLNLIIPVFFSHMGNVNDEALQNEAMDELRENILNAFQAFISHCPYEIVPHLQKIMDCCVEYLSYDPNYSYDNCDEMETSEYGDDDENYDEFEDDGYSDDDDTSWKVRRAAVKSLHSLISLRAEMISILYDKCMLLLLDRFKERDEAVKLDIIECVVQLIKTIEQAKESSSLASSQFLYVNERFTGDVDSVVKTCVKILRDKAANKPKAGVLNVLREATVLLNGGLDSYMDMLVVFMVECCQSTRESSLIRCDLALIEQVVTRHKPEVIQGHLKQLCPAVLECTSANWYKIVGDSLRILTALIIAMRPDTRSVSFDFTPYVRPIYKAILTRFEIHDIDQEVKDRAIESMGVLFSRLGDHLVEEIVHVLGILQDRLKNETTRISALSCLEKIATSDLCLNLKNTSTNIVNDLVTYLRQQSRTLKQRTLATLSAMVRVMDPSLYTSVMETSSVLISDQDLYLSQMVIGLTISLMHHAGPTILPLVANCIFPQCVRLIGSPLLQREETLETIKELIREVVKIDANSINFESIMSILIPLELTNGGTANKVAIVSLGRCLAAAILACPREAARTSAIDTLVTAALQPPSVGGDYRLVCICAVGEVGATADYQWSHFRAGLFAIIGNKDYSDAVRAGAATALGSCTMGNMALYLPEIMNALVSRTVQEEQYLLLSSLRKILIRHGSIPLPVLDILPVLEQHCNSDEEGVRNMVAECLGKLTIADPEKIMSFISKNTEDKDTLKRWTMATSLKYSIINETPVEVVQKYIMPFVVLINDPDIQVRRTVITSINSIAHHRPAIIHDILRDKIAGPLLVETRSSEMRTVELGPFKHKVDDALPLRKAAYTCILTMLETLSDVFPVSEFIKYLVHGLTDVADIQMLCHQIIAQIVQNIPAVILSDMNTLLTPLLVELNKPPKAKTDDGPSSTEASDLLRSSMRAIDAIASIPEARNDRKLEEILRSIQQKEHLRVLAESDHLAILKIK